MMKEKHVFIVEDEAHTRLALDVILKSAGYRVSISSCCADALKSLLSLSKESLPDLLVTDICTPEMNGIELIAELSRREVMIPTLVITGFQEQHTAALLAEKGCEHYLFKPFSDDEFLAKVNTVMAAFQ